MEEFKEYLKKNKASLIVVLVIWIFAEIFLISAISLTIAQSTVNGALNMEIFLEQFIPNMAGLKSFLNLAKSHAFGIFLRDTLIFTVIYLFFIFIGLWKGRKKGEYDKIEHGSSDWCEGGEQYRILSKNNGIILAEKNYLSLDKLGNTNVLIVGGSGSGKSASYSIPNAHQLLGSYIFTDPKGELYDNTAGFLRSQGYDIKLLNLVNPESSDSYNPLFHIKSQLDVDIIADTIVKGQKTGNSNADPYWDNMSELLLKALIYYLIATRPPEEQNLASCAELVRAANNGGDSNLLSDLINKLPYDHPARMNYKSVEIASDKTYQSILSSLQSSLGKFDSKEIADVTSTNTIDFEEIARRRTALYVVSSDTHTAYDFLLTIFFSQLIQQLYDFADRNGGKLPVKLFFILDEFANIGQIPDFDKKISTSRSRGISFSVILQNLDQLKAIYDKSYETIIGNCDTHVFLGSNSTATVEYFSKALGEKTISHSSKSVNRNNAAARQGFSESEQIMARALMTPDELRRLDNNECIIFEKGLKPIRAQKFWWYKKNNIVKDLTENAIDHNDFVNNNKGKWRKFNPYNPYVEPKEEEKNNEITSLDDLFEDNVENDVQNNVQSNTQNYTQNNVQNVQNSMQNMHNNAQSNTQNNGQNLTNYQKISSNSGVMSARQIRNQMNSLNINQNMQQNGGFINSNYDMNQNSGFGGNMSQINPNQEDDEEIDIEKELEAKFDELFGSDDEN